MKTFDLNIGELVSFVLREGSIDTRISSGNRLLLGTQIHQKLQLNDQKLKENYQKEVSLKEIYSFKNYDFILSGRADAIYTEENRVIIEEIKSTNKFNNSSFKYQESHKAQLFFYGLLFCLKNRLNRIKLRLRYYHIPNDEETNYDFDLTLEEIKDYTHEILNRWLDLGLIKNEWEELRNNSLSELNFLYSNYRKGQREMCLAVYNTLNRQNKVLLEAPTGIGKTIGSIFPTLKVLPSFDNYQVFYLTAKNTVQEEVNKTLSSLRENGALIKSVTITSKEKACLSDNKVLSCNPDDCEFAVDYYDKLNDILNNILKTHSNFDRKRIKEIALEYKVCPYQLSIDLSNWVDFIIADYNYIFDPIVQIEGFNDNRIILLDEAHNLPDRSREMFSSTISSEIFEKLYNSLDEDLNKYNNKLKKAVTKIIKYFSKLDRSFKDNNIIDLNYEDLNPLIEEIINFQNASFVYYINLKEKKFIPSDEVLLSFNNVSKEIYRFIYLIELINQKSELFNFFIQKENGNVLIRIFCLDASYFLNNILKDTPSILFSATLTPFDYYSNTILGSEEIPNISFNSPFNPNNVKVLCDASISTKYLNRKYSYKKIAEDINLLFTEKNGNYLVFFPSYDYLEKVLYEFQDLNENANIIIQDKNMSEQDRKEFLEIFKKSNNNIGFCVMGGIFSEGINLKNNSLIGAVIISPGLPGISYERNLIKNYFDETLGQGFSYAYQNPGMNKVLQSAGRVIRTEEDKGVILFIDDRFQNNFYKRLFPKHLKPIFINNTFDLKKNLKQFWNS